MKSCSPLAAFSILLFSFCVFPSIAQAADWPQFRGLGATGVSDEVGLPVKWSATENLRWKVDLPGRGLSSPVIAGGRVYVTACTGYLQERLHVLCFDAASGNKLWERQFWATGSTNCNRKTNMAAPTPACDGKRIYALFATCDLVCLDDEGNLLWYRALARDYPTITNQVGMAASPVLAKDTLVLLLENAGESFAAGIDKLTGKNRWKIERDRLINWTTPLLTTNGKQEEILLLSAKDLTALDPATGARRWTYESKGLSTIPSAVPAKDMILVPGGDLVALRPHADGTTPEVLWNNNRLKPATASPLYYRDRVYALAGGGILVCAEPSTGKILWQERVKGPFSASPIAADGKIYLVNEEGLASVVQVGDKPEVLAANALGETILATPAISGGAIFFRSDKHLFCIGAKK